MGRRSVTYVMPRPERSRALAGPNCVLTKAPEFSRLKADQVKLTYATGVPPQTDVRQLNEQLALLPTANQFNPTKSNRTPPSAIRSWCAPVVGRLHCGLRT